MTELSTILTQYFDMQKEIFKRFGYKGGGLQLANSTNQNWLRWNDKVVSSEQELTPELIETGAELCISYIDYEWSAPGYVMMYTDTESEPGRILEIFDDDKEIEPTQAQLDALENW